MLRRRSGAGQAWRRTALPGPRATLARGSAPDHPRTRPPRESPIVPPAEGRGAVCHRDVAGRAQREPPRPLRFAFFSRLSYWWDIRCAWICAMKSITTTTTISSEVPPK